MKPVKQRAIWAETIYKAGHEERVAEVSAVLEDLKVSPDADDRRAYREITSGEYEFVGFTPSISYLKADSDDPEVLECLWIHAWSEPCLLFKKKGVSACLIVKPALKFNESEASKYRENQGIKQLRLTAGLTG
jgi:hypothetical protein